MFIHPDIGTFALVVGVIVSTIFGAYEFLDKRKLSKLQETAATSTTDKNAIEAQVTVAQGLVEVVQLLMGVMNTFKAELTTQFKEGFGTLHGAIEDHAKQDDVRFSNIESKLDTVIVIKHNQ